MRAYLAAAGVLAAIPLFAALQDTHDIKWSPKVGEKSKYKIQIDGTMDIPQMGPMDMHFELTTEENVKEIVDDKITIGSKMVDMKILIGGNDITEMGGGGEASEQMNKETVVVYNRRQEMISKPDIEAMGGGERAMRLSQFVYPEGPMAVDGTWTLDMKGDKAKNLPPARTKYTFKGTEEIDGKKYYRIEYSFSELEGAKPMGAIGVIHLVPDTGRMFRVKADVNDAQFDEQMPPTNVKFALQLL